MGCCGLVSSRPQKWPRYGHVAGTARSSSSSGPAKASGCPSCWRTALTITSPPAHSDDRVGMDRRPHRHRPGARFPRLPRRFGATPALPRAGWGPQVSS
jgi:hypothetical protein